MSYVASFFNEPFINKQLNALVDETESHLLKRDKLIDKYFPTQTFETRNFMGMLTSRVAPAARVVAWGAEIPVTSHGSFEKVAAQLVKLAQRRRYDEHDMWDLYEAYKLANYMWRNIQTIHKPDGTVQRGANNDLATTLFGDVQHLLDGMVDRMDMMKWQAASTGALSIEDMATGAKFEIDYKKADAPYNHFPVPLIATGNTVEPTLNRWSDYNNAQGLRNIQQLTDLYYDTNGFMPDEIVMSRKLWNHFLDQKSTKDAARAMTTSEIGLVSTDMAKTLLERRELPKVTIFGEKYQEELPNGEMVTVNYLNDNRIVFMKENMGISAIGPTMESKTNIMGGGTSKDVPNPKAGIYLKIRSENTDPENDVVTTIASFIPIVMNPKLLMAQTMN